MLISRSGQVLAHNNPGKVGLFLTDAASRSLVQSPARKQFLANNGRIIDVAVPIQIGQRHVGWARVALGRERILADMRDTMLRSGIFVLLACTLAFLAALMIANRLGARIGALVQATEGVRVGDFGARAIISGRQDEITRLADSFNRMLDTLEKNQQELRTASRYSRSLIEANFDPLMTISPDGKITDVNHASEQATGRSRETLVGMDFPDCFTEPDRARELCAQALLKEAVIDYPLAIRHTSGRVTDVIYNAGVFRNEAGEVLGVFAAARDITERKQAEARIHHMAQYDTLTDLPNRALFYDRLKQAIHYARRNRRKLAVMFLDLDKFKPINDNHGHAVGDCVLQAVAQRLRACVRVADTVGRIGGDEFTILLHDVESEAAALQVAEKIHQALNQPFIVDGKYLEISSSTGVALFPEHGGDELELARHADFAMYHAKASGRDNVKAFRPGMSANPLPVADTRT
jgi:diguanylate cyclase (GGDEF)-like protein/PAS domain S-box-containing protein